MDLHLAEQSFAKDYKSWYNYYNYMLTAFYVTRISKQCARFKQRFPDNVNWQALYTDKFVLTNESTRATMGRNVTDTHFVEDTYYNIAKYIHDHPEDNKQSIINYLAHEHRCIPKAFAMQYIIGAMEASDLETLQKCINKVRTIHWGDAYTNNWEVADGKDKLKVFGLNE